MKIVVDHALWLPPNAPEDFVADVVAACTFDNPEFYKKQALNFSTWNTPREIVLAVKHDDGTVRVPRGMTDVLRDAAKKYGVKIKWDDCRLTVPVKKLRFCRVSPVDYYGRLLPKRVTPWDYQELIAETAERYENLLVRSPTASGKTFAGFLLISKLAQRAFVCVHSVNLADQWADLCERLLGIKPRRLGGGKKITPPDSSPVTIATQQTLHRRLEKETPHFGLLIMDETQRAAAATVRYDVSHFPARYRLGISESEKRKDKMEFLIHAQFGKVRAEVPRARLVADKRVVPVDFVVVETGWRVIGKLGTPIDPKALEYGDIIKRMVECEERSILILNDVLRECKAPNTGLVLCDRVAMCRWFREAVWKGGLNAGLVIGGQSQRVEFERTATGLRDGSLRVGVGTSAVYEGFDVPRLNRGFITTPSATNPQKLGQQIGRWARPGGEGTPRVYYYLDSHMFPWHLQNLRRFVNSDRARFASAVLIEEDGTKHGLMR